MKSSIHLTLFTLLSIAPPLVAQLPGAEVSYAARSTATARSGDPATLRSHIQRGDELQATGQFGAAAREYKAAVQIHRSEQTFAGHALWKIAETHHDRGEELLAAMLFDEVAEEAETFGQLELQARGLLEAALRYHRSGRDDLALRRAARLELLLESPFLPESVRSELQGRIRRS